MKKIPKERLLGKQLGKEATEEGLSYYRWNADSGRFHNDEGKEEKNILKANALNSQISKDKKLLSRRHSFIEGTQMTIERIIRKSKSNQGQIYDR